MIAVVSIAFVAWITLFFSHGRVILSIEDVDFDLRSSMTTEVSKDVKDLLKTILETIEHCSQEGLVQLPEQGRLPRCADHLESLAIELSPEKKKVLSEILSLMLSLQEQKAVKHKLQESSSKKPIVAKGVEMFSTQPDKQINVQELLRFLLEPSTTATTSVTTPSELKYLKKLIFNNKKNELREDPILKKTLKKFLDDAKKFERGFHHFA